MVNIPSLNKIIIYGLLGATAIVFFRRAVEPGVGLGKAATEVASSVGTFGTGLGQVGAGIYDFFSGIGSGTAQLFNPLFTLRDLIYGPQAGNQPAPTAATEGTTPNTNPSTTAAGPAPIPAPASSPEYVTNPVPLTIQQATSAYNQGLLSIGIGNTATKNQVRNILERADLSVRGEQTQLYVNRRNELVRLRPTSAAQLVRRGYVRAL